MIWWPAYATWGLVSLLAGAFAVALVLAAVGGYTSATQTITYERDNPWATPTVAGLRQVVLAEKLPCLGESFSMKATEAQRYASTAVWHVDCPAGDRYAVTLTRDGAVVSVVRR